VQPWATPPADAKIADLLKVSETHIAMAFRIPLQILGIGGQPLGSTEALMQFWISTGLGFALNHIEEAIGLLFQLVGQPDEYVEFDTQALLRSMFKDRIDALARGVQGGILSPNEARASEGYDEVKYGDEPRVQQQVVPLSAAAKIPAAPGAPGAPPQPAADAPTDDETDAADAETDKPKKPPEKDFRYASQREFRNIIDAAARINRNRA
jgi:hypothetical protein